MGKRVIKHIISLFLIIAFFSNHQSQAETIIAPSTKDVFTEASKLPHTEMKLVKQDITSACHCTIQKKTFTSLVLQVERRGQAHFYSQSLFIKNSLLLTRSYLSHIYPSHYFW